MCFSADANFVASAAIAVVGAATLRHVRRPRALLFGVTPLLFAAHQFTEGFVWLGIDGRVSAATLQHCIFLFMLYAQAILPGLLPLAVLLMEPRGRRRYAILGCTLLGAGVFAWTLYGVVGFPNRVLVTNHCLNYRNPMTSNVVDAGAYLLATCGALLLSSHRVVRWFGLANLAGVVAVALVNHYAFTSIWCLYAAMLSVMIYWQFSRGHIDVERPNSSFSDVGKSRVTPEAA